MPRIVNYPYGIMKNYRRTQLNLGRKHHNKYHARKIMADGHKFDSKAEYQYYELLKLKGVMFRIHPKYEIVPHSKFNREHNYTPDFVLYKNTDDFKNHRPYEVDDIKGIPFTNVARTYDNLRMDLWQRRYHMPITIVREKRGGFAKKQRKTFKY